jgi:hypothetical protein
MATTIITSNFMFIPCLYYKKLTFDQSAKFLQVLFYMFSTEKIFSFFKSKHMSHQNLFCYSISKGIYTFYSSINDKTNCCNSIKHIHVFIQDYMFWSKKTVIRPP